MILTAEAELKLYALTGDKTKLDAAAKLAELYGEAVKDKEITFSLLGQMLREYSSDREGAKSAMQVSQVADEAGIRFQFLLAAQNQAVIEQNQKIIDLLERILRKPGR